MFHKKILTIVIILLLAFVIVGSVQAEANGTKTTIRGIDFNIPEGFQESELSDKNNVSDSINATTETMIYTGNDGVFTIMVIEYGDGVTDNLLKDFGDNATIKNINGAFKKEDGGNCSFTYLKDKCLVQVTGQDKEFIENVIIE